MRLNVWAFALACACLWGIGIFFLTWWVMAFEGSGASLPFIGQVYRGYRVTPFGSFIGLLWGFFDALIAGALLAWLYNIFAGHYRGPAGPSGPTEPPV